MRIYTVTETINNQKHLVEASTPAQAISHVVKRQITAHVASGSEVAQLMKAGIVPQSAATAQAELVADKPEAEPAPATL